MDHGKREGFEGSLSDPQTLCWKAKEREGQGEKRAAVADKRAFQRTEPRTSSAKTALRLSQIPEQQRKGGGGVYMNLYLFIYAFWPALHLALLTTYNKKIIESG